MIFDYFTKESFEVDIFQPTYNELDIFVERYNPYDKYYIFIFTGLLLISLLFNIYLRIQLKRKQIFEKIYLKAVKEKEKIKKQYTKLKDVFDKINDISKREDRSAKKMCLIASQLYNLKKY